MIPHIYKFRTALTTSSPSGPDAAHGLIFSDKAFRYIFPLQLALSAWPGSLLGALVGWVVGYAWRGDLLPGVVTRWRLPGWMVGVRTLKPSREFEGLRRRLEGENATTAPHSAAADATASGVQGGLGEGGDAGRRRTLGQQMLDQVSGAV